MPIEIVCERCGMQYKVSEAKAGKKGRCQLCGARIIVPLVQARTAASTASTARTTRWVFIASIPALLVIVVVLFLRSSGSGADEPRQPTPEPPIISDELRQIRDQRYQLAELEKRVKRHCEARAAERRLRARDVLRKTRNYEPISDQESEFRRQVIEEHSKLARSDARQAQADEDVWQLNSPTTDAEHAELVRLSEELEREALALAADLARVGVSVSVSSDTFGRKRLDCDEALKQLPAKREELQKRQEALK